jgi:hypothetical protein
LHLNVRNPECGRIIVIIFASITRASVGDETQTSRARYHVGHG